MSTVVKTLDLPQSPSEIWEKIGEFSKLDEWHPAVIALEPSTHNGRQRRNLTLPDGATLLEERTDNGSDPFSYAYTIIDGPLPVKDYQSNISVAENGGGSTITWRSTFQADGAPEAQVEEIIAGIYQAGFDALG